MELFIKALLQQSAKMSEISDLVGQITDIVDTRKDEDEIDEYDLILDYYNIPRDNFPDDDGKLPDPSRDLFCRDFFIDRIFDTIKGITTFDELDYVLSNWEIIFIKLDELYPDGISGDVELSVVIRNMINNGI